MLCKDDRLPEEVNGAALLALRRHINLCSEVVLLIKLTLQVLKELQAMP